MSYTIAPLPGSEKDLALVMKQATADQGVLTMDGIASITSDVAYSFIYVRVVSVTLRSLLSLLPLKGPRLR